jgi:hypothetical protein
MHYIQSLALNTIGVITAYTEVNIRRYNAISTCTDSGRSIAYTSAVRLALARFTLRCLVNTLNLLIGTPEKLKNSNVCIY